MNYIRVIGMLLFFSFWAGLGFCSQEMEISHNDNRGAHFSEVDYKVKLDPHSVNAKYVNESLGKKYLVDYRYGFDDWFGFATYTKDTVFGSNNIDIGAGYGLYLLKSKMWREKVSVAAIFRGSQYITSLRLKTYIKAGKLTIKNVSFYRLEVQEQTSESNISFKLSKKTSLGYKNSIESIKGDVNHSNRLYIKVVL